MTEKKCTKCGEVKALDLFNKNKSTKSGLQERCRECQKATAKAYRDKYADKLRQYYLDNAEKMRLKSSAWYKSNTERARETAKKYNKLNKKKIRDLSAIYREKYKDKLAKIRIEKKIDILLCARKYRENNHEKVLVAAKVWREANQDKVKEYREAQYKTLPDGYVIARLRVKNPPQELIELKREQLILIRLTRGIKNERKSTINPS